MNINIKIKSRFSFFLMNFYLISVFLYVHFDNREEMNFMFFLTNLLNIEEDNEITVVRDQIKTKIEIIENLEIKKIYTLTADEFLIKKFGKIWFQYLFELYFFQTCSAGQSFFKSFYYFVEKQNLEMIKLYAIAFNFIFYEQKPDEKKEFDILIQKFFPEITSEKSITPYKSKKKIPIFHNFFWIILAVFLLYLIGNIMNVITLKTLQNKMVSVLFQIKKELL